MWFGVGEHCYGTPLIVWWVWLAGECGGATLGRGLTWRSVGVGGGSGGVRVWLVVREPLVFVAVQLYSV